MQEGIEPTISTIPLGCTNEIVSGDQPSTVSGNHSQHTISFSSECGWIPCEPLARDSTGCREQNPSFDSVLIHIIFTTIPPNSSLFWHKVSILILIPSEVYKFVSTKGSWKYHHVTPSLSGLFPLSDPWNSSQSPSHRPSTFELCDFYLCSLVEHIRIKTLLVTRGECPEKPHSLFLTVIFLQTMTFTCILS